MTADNGQFDAGAKPEASASDAENRFPVALAKNEESFPVLQAFQSFLDQERERSRRRLTALSVCFMSALVVLMLVFAAFFAVFFTHVMSHNEAQQDRMLDLIARDSSAKDAPDRPAAEADKPAAEPAAPGPDIEALVEKLVAERLRSIAAPAAQTPAAPAAPADAAAKSGPAADVSAPKPQDGPAPAPKPSASQTAAADPGQTPARPKKPNRPGIISPPSPRPPAASSGQPPAPSKKAPQSRDAAAASKVPAGKPASAPKPAEKTRVVSVKPVRALSVPGGYEADAIVVQTESGAMVPMRTLLPSTGAAK